MHISNQTSYFSAINPFFDYFMLFYRYDSFLKHKMTLSHFDSSQKQALVFTFLWSNIRFLPIFRLKLHIFYIIYIKIIFILSRIGLKWLKKCDAIASVVISQLKEWKNEDNVRRTVIFGQKIVIFE